MERLPEPTSPAGRAARVVGSALAAAAVFVTLRAVGLATPPAGAAATVVLMALLWILEPIPLWATALVPLFAFPPLGAAPLGEVALQYLDPVNFLFLGGMWIAAAMEQWGLHRRLALGVVARTGTSHARVVLGFMTATAFVSMLISNTAAALMMFPIAMAVLERLEAQVGGRDERVRRFGLALMLGIAYAASIGGIGTKVGTGTNLVFVKQAAALLGLEVSFVDWLKLGLPIVVVTVPLAWLYLVRVAARVPPGDLPGGRAAITEARAALGPMRGGEWAALAAFLSAGFLWAFRQEIDLGAVTIPGWSSFVPWTWADLLGRPPATLPPPLAELLGPRGAEPMVAMIIAALLFVTPVQRRPLRLALSRVQASRISWGLLVLLGGGFAMAHGISRSGLSDLLAARLTALGPLPPLPALVALCLVTIALSEVASNTATASILLPVLAAAAPGLGLHPAVLMFATTLAASFGFMLPAGTPPNAVVFSSGYIRVKEMARIGLVVDVMGGLLVAAICYWLAPRALGLLP